MKTFKTEFYNMTGIVDIQEEKCVICKRQRICLSVDNSEDEYGPITICLECIRKEFQEYEENRKSINP